MRIWRMRKATKVILTEADRLALSAIVRDRNSPQKHVWRAQIVLLTAAGCGTMELTRRTGTSKTSVWRWQERFLAEGVPGLLRDKTRPSRIPPLGTEVEARVVAATQTPAPGETTHWTATTMAKHVGISVSSVQRIWRKHGLQPHRIRQFKLSNDPRFAAKLIDIVGLYVNPPEHAVVLSIDEKSQIQALDRTQPGLPMKKGRCGTMTHDYKRKWHHDIVCGPQCAERHGDRPLHAAPPPSGVHPLSQCHRGRRAKGQGDPRHRRQLRHPQAPEGQGVAGSPSAVELSLHAHIGIVAERRRLFRQTHQTASPARRVLLGR